MAELMESKEVDPFSGEKSQGEAIKSQSRRSLLQIRMEILQVVTQGYGKPTQIMYRANLSWTVLQSQLRSFVESGLLTSASHGSRRTYKITNKGIAMVQSYQTVIDQIMK